MSNALAIAAVTRLLKDLLNDAMVNGDVSSDLGVDVLVSALPPDQIPESTGDVARSQLNVFLHRVTPNPALHNLDLPTRDSRGSLVQRPRLALDLHYLLTAYAAEELHAEILLGYSMELFHENPILPRGLVRDALRGGVDGAILPPAFRGAAASRLAEQIELIKIVPQTLDGRHVEAVDGASDALSHDRRLSGLGGAHRARPPCSHGAAGPHSRTWRSGDRAR